MNLKEKIKQLFGLLDKIDVNSRDAKGETPLMQASRQNLETTADLLVKKGSDVNTVGLMGDSPLMQAVSQNNLEMMESLLSAGADPNYYNEQSLGEHATALMIAAKNDAVDAISLLIDKGAKVNIQHQMVGLTALMVAAKYNSKEALEMLLEHGAEKETKTFGMIGKGMTAICFAAMEGHKEVVTFLHKKGAKKKPLRAVDRKKIPRDMVKWLKAKKLL